MRKFLNGRHGGLVALALALVLLLGVAPPAQASITKARAAQITTYVAYYGYCGGALWQCRWGEYHVTGVVTTKANVWTGTSYYYERLRANFRRLRICHFTLYLYSTPGVTGAYRILGQSKTCIGI